MLSEDSIREELKKVIAFPDEKVKPIYGICMGNQLVGLRGGVTPRSLVGGGAAQKMQ